jgi:signal transduction histidine kinase
MAIKEALNNAVKYSGATELRLQIQWRGERLIVVVVDNGTGFDRDSVPPGRNGLTNMAQRMSELGGECQVASRPGEGCRVEFSIPLRHTRWHTRAWAWTTKPFTAAWERNGKRPTNETDTRL